MDILRALLERGANPNELDSEGRPPLFKMLTKRRDSRLDRSLIGIFIQAGANPNHLLRDGYRPLSFAVSNELSWAVDTLLQNGAEVNPSNGHFPLYDAILIRSAPILRSLLSAGAEVDRPVSEGKTCLQVAAEKCHWDMLELLLRYGADPNRRNSLGNTPLHIVVLSAPNTYIQKHCIRGLLQAGADRSIKNKEGLTALALAKKLKLRELLDPLEQ